MLPTKLFVCQLFFIEATLTETARRSDASDRMTVIGGVFDEIDGLSAKFHTCILVYMFEEHLEHSSRKCTANVDGKLGRHAG